MAKSSARKSRQAAALEQSNRDLEQFAYVAAHDLQEPLRMLAVYLQTLAQQYAEQLPPQGRSLLDLSLQASHRMQVLINDLLNSSRPNVEQGGFARVDMGEVFQEAVENLTLAIQERAAVVTCAELPVVWGNHSQLVQLLQNLIGNGVKFHGDRPAKVHVAAEQAGESWRFSVRDEGQGIPREHARHLFEMFQRLPTSKDAAGQGIGLAASKRIVERHGGEIWFESEPGQGTTFFFALPAPPAEPRPSSASRRASAAT